jgi:hypothetical protein
MKKKLPANFIILQALILSLTSVVYSTAAEYYVSPNGTGTWPNCTTIQNPCRASTDTHIDFLTETVAGDTVYFLDGVYAGIRRNPDISSYTPGWWPRNSGTEANPITFKSLNLHGAELRGLSFIGDGTGEYAEGVIARIIGTNGQDYIIFEGFELTAVDDGGTTIQASILLNNSTGSQVKNLTVRGATHNKGGAVNYEGIRTEGSDNILIENCYVFDFNEVNNNINTTGYKNYRSTNVTIKNCLFENNNMGVRDKQGGGGGHIYENNLFIGNRQDIIVSLDNSGNSNNGIIRNNLFLNTIYTVFGIESSSNKADNFTVVNNTFYSSVTSGLRYVTVANGVSHQVYNNIFGNQSSYPSMRFPLHGTTSIEAIDHNLFDHSGDVALLGSTNYRLSGWKTSGALIGGGNPGMGSITGAPSFVNGSGTMSERDDFRLAFNSPAKGAGRNGADMGADIDLVGPMYSSVGGDVSTPSGFSTN